MRSMPKTVTGVPLAEAVAEAKSISRNQEPLRYRRVRHSDGREGHIEHAQTHHGFDGKPKASVTVHWDGMTPSWAAKRLEPDDVAECELLPAPPIEVPVRQRKVLFRGHKEQVAERLLQLGPAPEGTDRYVEFDPQPMAYKRWRIVYVGPPLDPETVAGTPDQRDGADRLRKMAKDNADYDPDPGYGY